MYSPHRNYIGLLGMALQPFPKRVPHLQSLTLLFFMPDTPFSGTLVWLPLASQCEEASLNFSERVLGYTLCIRHCGDEVYGQYHLLHTNILYGLIYYIYYLLPIFHH